MLERALGVTSTHPGPMIIRKAILTYRSGDVVLVIHSKFLMTWGILEAVEKGIWDFVSRYEYVDFDFDVGAPGTGLESFYGAGALGSRSAALSR